MSTRESRFFNKLCFLANLQLNNKNLIDNFFYKDNFHNQKIDFTIEIRLFLTLKN